MKRASQKPMNVAELQKPANVAAVQQPQSAPATTPKGVAELAYALWLDRGCPIGSPEVDWFRAEEQLKLYNSASTASPNAQSREAVRHSSELPRTSTASGRG